MQFQLVSTKLLRFFHNLFHSCGKLTRGETQILARRLGRVVRPIPQLESWPLGKT
jgi:hypothetical protein